MMLPVLLMVLFMFVCAVWTEWTVAQRVKQDRALFFAVWSVLIVGCGASKGGVGLTLDDVLGALLAKHWGADTAPREKVWQMLVEMTSNGLVFNPELAVLPPGQPYSLQADQANRRFTPYPDPASCEGDHGE